MNHDITHVATFKRKNKKYNLETGAGETWHLGYKINGGRTESRTLYRTKDCWVLKRKVGHTNRIWFKFDPLLTIEDIKEPAFLRTILEKLEGEWAEEQQLRFELADPHTVPPEIQQLGEPKSIKAPVIITPSQRDAIAEEAKRRMVRPEILYEEIFNRGYKDMGL